MFSTRLEANKFYADTLQDVTRAGDNVLYEFMHEMTKKDLWFLMTVMLGRKDMNYRPEIDPDWLYARCVDIQYEPDGYLDVWAREFYKSTIITYGKTIQDILIDQERTFGIFSVKRELAQDFLKQIKETFEANTMLKKAFPDVLYEDPENQSKQWGMEKGIRVKRKSIRREETVEAWGLFSLPTGNHFDTLIFDDVVTEKSVTNHEQLTKAYDQMRLAFYLGSHGGNRRFIGTFYHSNDAWRSVIKAKSAKLRLHPGRVDGKIDGAAVFLTEEALLQKRRDHGPYVFACQTLLDPVADQAQGFKKEWIRSWMPKPEFYDKMNKYIIVDPAGERNEKTRGHDYTNMWVVGAAPDKRLYVIDGLRDRLNLTDRCSKLIEFVRVYNPIRVGYEQYGMQADIAHIETEMDRVNFHFDIVALGGSLPKNDKIRRLVPWFEQGKIYMPGYLTKRDYEGAYIDIIQAFVDEEYLPFPVGTHDDMIENLSRMLDEEMELVFPDHDAYVELRGGYPNAGQANTSIGYDIDPLAASRQGANV